MAYKGGPEAAAADTDKLKAVDPANKEQMSLLEEMRQHTKDLERLRKNEDPRMSFVTPEFKEASRVWKEAFGRNFDKPVEWSLQKEFPWSEPTLMRLQQPLTVDGKPWPLDASGKPAVSAV